MKNNIERILKDAKHIHFIGIGGSGMCPLAEILHSKGYIITGSDNNSSDNLTRLISLGIKATIGHDEKNIDGADMIVYTAALLPGNPELIAANERGIPVFERSLLFGAISKRYENCVAISGTHGKTTVTSMVTEILIKANKSPSALIGGKLPLTNSNGVLGESSHFICEACEYKNTYHELYPNVSVILNIANDHMEFFKTEENLISSFNHFANMAKSTVIYNKSDEKTKTAVSGITDKKLISFGTSNDCDCYPLNIEFVNGAFATFNFWYYGEMLGKVELGVPGEHNIQNALAAICAAMYSGATFLQCQSALKDFTGASRRFEVLGEYNGAVVVDDYAHHPNEIKATLKTAKALHYKRVIAVFQPFTFSRTQLLLNEFAKALSIADKVVLTEIMGSREINEYGIETKDLAAEIDGCTWFDTFDKVANHVRENAKQGDLILTLGCGDVYKVAHKILEK